MRHWARPVQRGLSRARTKKGACVLHAGDLGGTLNAVLWGSHSKPPGLPGLELALRVVAELKIA